MMTKPTALFRLSLGALAWLLLAALPLSDFFEPGNVFRFVPIMLLASLAAWGAIRRFGTVPLAWQQRVFWGVAIGLRCLALLMSPGDDIYRYLWEGHIQWLGHNPYLLAPDSPALFALRDQQWSLINHNFWPAIYPPGAEWLLKMLTAFGPSVLVIKAICTLGDLLTVWLILKLIPGSTRYEQAAWYAWNPLVIYAFAGSGHFDSLMLAPLLLAAYALDRAKPNRDHPAHWGWSVVVALSLGASIAIKLVPLVLVPVFALALRTRMVVLVLTPLILLAFAGLYGFPQVRIFDTLREFVYVSRFNDFIWWISEKVIWPNPEQKNGYYTPIATVAALLASFIALWDWKKALLWVMAIALIFSTVVHPWYVVWILPFATMRKAYGWHLLAASIFLAFLWWESTPWWQAWVPTPLLNLAISLPPIIAIATSYFYRRRNEAILPA